MVDESFVRKFFKPGEDPIGTRFGLTEVKNAATFEIVGVVRNANYSDPTGHWRPPLFFLPLAQHVHYDTAMAQMIDDRMHMIQSVVLKMNGSMNGLEPQVRRAFSEVDPNLTLVGMRTLEEQVAGRLDQERTVAQLTGLFGVLALVLARSVFTASRPMASSGAPARLACASRWALIEAAWSPWCCAARFCRSSSGC